MALFTLLIDHEDGAQMTRQVDARTAREAVKSWAENLMEATWEGFCSEHREQILDQFDSDCDEEDAGTPIDNCRGVWRWDYVISPEKKCVRLLVVKTAEN